MSHSADVAIIGAGLSGCAAAIAAGKLGIHAVMFEKGRPFKDKACGDAFLPSAVFILTELGLSEERFVSLGGTPFESIEMFDNSKLIWRHNLAHGRGWILPRRQVDQALRDIAAKTSLINYESKVIGLKPGSHRDWHIRYETGGFEREVQTPAVILATGADNKLANAFNLSGAPLPSVALSAYIPCDHFRPPVFQFTDLCRNGYAWVFPAGETTVNAGLCMFDDHVHALK